MWVNAQSCVCITITLCIMVNSFSVLSIFYWLNVTVNVSLFEIFPSFRFQFWWLRQQGTCRQNGRPGFDSWVRKIPWRREWLPTPVFLPAEFYGQRRLVGYTPWGCKDLDTTEPLTLYTFYSFYHCLCCLVPFSKLMCFSFSGSMDALYFSPQPFSISFDLGCSSWTSFLSQ